MNDEHDNEAREVVGGLRKATGIGTVDAPLLAIGHGNRRILVVNDRCARGSVTFLAQKHIAGDHWTDGFPCDVRRDQLVKLGRLLVNLLAAPFCAPSEVPAPARRPDDASHGAGVPRGTTEPARGQR